MEKDTRIDGLLALSTSEDRMYVDLGYAAHCFERAREALLDSTQKHRVPDLIDMGKAFIAQVYMEQANYSQGDNHEA